MREVHVRWQHEKKNYWIWTTFYSCYNDLVFDSCPVEVNRWYHSCFVRSQQIFTLSLRLFLHGTSLLHLSKILKAMPLKPQPLRSVWNIRRTQRFLAMNNTYSLTSNVFFEIMRNLDKYWCTVLVHQYGRRKSTKTSGVHFLYESSFFSLEN